MSTLLLTACGGGSTKGTPTVSLTPSIPGVQVFADLSHEHVQGKISYPEVPPVGGKHNPRWQACDIYRAPVPNETAVHSIEHGGIWITYRPDLPAAQVATLADIQRTNIQYVLVSPYAGLPSPVVVSTWGLQLKVASANDPRIVTFVQTYAGGNQGKEQGAPCKGNGLTLDEAKKLIG